MGDHPSSHATESLAPPTGAGEGLSSADAHARYERDGPNRLPAPRLPSPWFRLAGQMVHFFALMLWGAAGLAFLAGLPELGVAIILVVIVNGGFAFLQEYRADRAAAALRDLLPRRSTVIRDGTRREIDADFLVVDDVVALSAGDRISADLEIFESHGLSVDTSTLTGETVPITLETGERAFAGTFVVEGEATARVDATGPRTRLAGIAELTQATPGRPPPLAAELRRVVRTIAVIAIGVGAAFFALALLVGTPAGDGFILAVGVTVALVPEALLPTVSLSLALGAQRMADHHALVRRLDAVETLGSTTFICSDKTGTLTLNQMTVTEVWTPVGSVRIEGAGYAPEGVIDAASPAAFDAARAAATDGARCSTGRAVERDGEWTAQGDPMEAAIDALARRLDADVERDAIERPERARFPFDTRRRRMSLVAGDRLLVKGAPDSVLPRCRPVPGSEERVAEMTGRGLRVLAVADRPVPDPSSAQAPDALERDLTLLGLLGLEDPPRTGASASIAACRRAGIRVAMVTGDHPSTALSVAREVGLASETPRVVVGADLPTDDALLGALIDRDGIVLARVGPEDKMRIARALRDRGHIVAMTGDGVNDGPALREADIGVAMGAHGTDVAREAADLVLLDDDFSTIVAAVEQGRATFANMRRFLTYHLTDNVAEMTPFVVWALSGARFPLALGVLQVLALDIGTDTFSAVGLGAEPPARHALDQPPARGRLLDASVARRAFGLLGPTQAVFEMAAFLATLLAWGWRPGDSFPTGAVLLTASGAAFTAIVVGQSVNAFLCRSGTRHPWDLGWTTNRLLVVAVAVELLVAGVFLFVGPVASALDHQAPSMAGWGVALATGPAILAVDSVDKAWRARRRRSTLDE